MAINSQKKVHVIQQIKCMTLGYWSAKWLTGHHLTVCIQAMWQPSSRACSGWDRPSMRWHAWQVNVTVRDRTQGCNGRTTDVWQANNMMMLQRWDVHTITTCALQGRRHASIRARRLVGVSHGLFSPTGPFSFFLFLLKFSNAFGKNKILITLKNILNAKLKIETQ